MADNDSLNPNICLCYSFEDEGIAVEVCEDLEQYDIEVWNDPRDETCKYYNLNVADAVGYIEVVILIFSSNANESASVKKDIELAFSHNKPVIVLNMDGSAFQGEFEFFLRNCYEIRADENIHRTIRLLVEDITRISHNPDAPAVYKPDIQKTGMVKPKVSFSSKTSSSPFLYLSYDDADFDFIVSQINQYKIMGVNFKHQVDSRIKDSALLSVFVSKNSCKSSKIKDDILNAISNDVGIFLIHLDESEPDFGRMFNLKYGSKLKKTIKYSIYKSQLDELTYIGKCEEIFQLFGVKK